MNRILETGYVYDMKMLSDLIKDEVLIRFDHKNLNLDVTYFKDLNPTAERHRCGDLENTTGENRTVN